MYICLYVWIPELKRFAQMEDNVPKNNRAREKVRERTMWVDEEKVEPNDLLVTSVFHSVYSVSVHDWALVLSSIVIA